MADSRRSVAVEASDETIEGWISRPRVSSELREHLSAANVLLVPTEEHGSNRTYFPVGTEKLLRFLQSSEQQGLSVDICASDEDYQELALYADWLVIAELVVTSVVAPLVVNSIWDYIKRHPGKKQEETLVKSKVVVQDNGRERSVSFSYEGPASEYREAMTEALRESGLAPGELDHEQLPSGERDRLE